MSQALKIEFPKGADVRTVLATASEHVEECDTIVILMQKKTGGVYWFAPDAMRLETLVFLCTRFLHDVMGRA